jgi:hypothetical protein
LLPEAGSYLGFIFARGETARGAEASVRAAHAQLHFEISKEIVVAARPVNRAAGSEESPER